ncbi:hypothetical protein GCM10009557_31860 [Virgisporangium ochraceum]|uniref:Uncharacterized protein n=1 Tax=Virgisporangium ochraceum TaxID=65505 RepID=A0A8J4A560_9ACTN|nr:hypothetical protein [Virgisporangium ochraceum]GIJ75093.1 hypothetical protein Voc01_100100 [Virgisporangium ochraceum]
MTAAPHGMALRAPWYACLREDTDRFGVEALSPCIQKYDADDFVTKLVADPQRSLRWTPADYWSFPVLRTTDDRKTLRAVLSPYKMARSEIRKLYQPNHQRFYAVTAELFCDVAGLPRPGPGDDVAVRFVMRRTQVTFAADADRTRLREFGRLAAKELVGHDPFVGEDPRDEMAADVAAAYRARARDAERVRAFEQRHAATIAELGIKSEVQGWYVRRDGRAGWHPVPQKPADPVPEGAEQTFPMWRIPRPEQDCVPGPGRSLWFGTVPTYSGENDADGAPKLGDKATYHLQCLAEKQRSGGCPPIVTVSEPTVQFRLAAFFDPSGTANRRIHVRLPDFESVQAHLSGGRPLGGVEFERPPGSQLPPGPFGKVPDQPAAGQAGGAATENCFYAIELITIVAMFVLGLFMPIVIFVFQLWWMLMLKFCWPPDTAVVAALDKLTGTTLLGGLDPADKAKVSALFGVAEEPATAKLVDALVTGNPRLATDLDGKTDQAKKLSKEFGEAMQPTGPARPAQTRPLPDVHDPLCPVTAPPSPPRRGLPPRPAAEAP